MKKSGNLVIVNWFCCSHFNSEEMTECEISQNALFDHAAQVAYSQTNIYCILNIYIENWRHVNNSETVETGFC